MNPGARKGPIWTPAEDAALRELWQTLEAKEIAARLPGRTEIGVWHRMRRLGLTKRRRWTERDDEKLRLLWGCPIKTVAQELGRTIAAVYWRAQLLGLPLGVPEDGERLTTAASRCGYSITTMRMILDWAGVPIWRGLTRGALKTKNCTHWVESELVDEAVARWCQTETPTAAARRLGMSAARVVARLLASGLELPPKPADKRHWRIPSEIIDRAIAIVVRRGKHLEVRKEAA